MRGIWDLSLAIFDLKYRSMQVGYIPEHFKCTKNQILLINPLDLQEQLVLQAEYHYQLHPRSCSESKLRNSQETVLARLEVKSKLDRQPSRIQAFLPHHLYYVWHGKEPFQTKETPWSQLVLAKSVRRYRKRYPPLSYLHCVFLTLQPRNLSY